MGHSAIGVTLVDSMKVSRPAKFGIWAVICCSWLIQALAARHTLDADGVSYLNIAHACVRGDWHAMVNGYWSPGYPFVLTVWLKLWSPSHFWEPLAVRMLGFATLAAALACFEYFLPVYFKYRKQVAEGNAGEFGEALPDDAIRLAGYFLFFWITVFLTPAHLDQPDILVFIFYLLACSLCMQLELSGREWWRHILLGVVLGLAYLVKAVMFALALAFLAVLILRKDRWRFLPRMLAAMAVFAAVSMPFVLALSKSKGRFTFGDAGAVNYRQMMGAADEAVPDDSSQASAIAAPKPAAAPHIAEYTKIIQLGTFPPWADPSHGYKGGPQRFPLRRQLNRIHIVLRYYFDLYIVQLGGVSCGLLVLLLWGGDFPQFGKRFLSHVALWLPAVAGLALYGLIRVEGRFLAGFTMALFAACAAGLRVGTTDLAQKLVRSVVWAMCILLLAQAAMEVGHDGLKLFADDGFPDWQVATTLHQMGVKPGERVSYMGDTLSDHVWAHLGEVTIAAEIPQEDVLIFWAADEAEKEQATEWLAASGAKVLVTRGVPSTALSSGWRRVGDTDYYVLELAEKKVH
jgi:hypothetical protein